MTRSDWREVATKRGEQNCKIEDQSLLDEFAHAICNYEKQFSVLKKQQRKTKKCINSTASFFFRSISIFFHIVFHRELVDIPYHNTLNRTFYNYNSHYNHKLNKVWVVEIEKVVLLLLCKNDLILVELLDSIYKKDKESLESKGQEGERNQN